MKNEKKKMKMKTKTKTKTNTKTKTKTKITIVTITVDATSTSSTTRPLRPVGSYQSAFVGVECLPCICSTSALIYAFFTGL